MGSINKLLYMNQNTPTTNLQKRQFKFRTSNFLSEKKNRYTDLYINHSFYHQYYQTFHCYC